MVLRPVTPESIFEIYTIESPEFSPDGKNIIFVRLDTDAEENDYLRSIWIVDSAGRRKPVRLTSGNHDMDPHWSPDGKSIAFISSRGGSPQVYMIPVNGGEAVRITNMVGGASDVRWSPDGQWLAFISEATEAEREMEDRGLMYDPVIRRFSGEWSEKHRAGLKDPRIITKLPYKTGKDFFDGRYRHIYVIPAKGGTPKRLTNGDFHHSTLQWTPDSRYVVSNSYRIQNNGDENFELNFTSEKAAEKAVEKYKEAIIGPNDQIVAERISFIPQPQACFLEQLESQKHTQSLDGGRKRYELF